MNARWGSHSGVAENSSPLRCDAVSLGPQIPELYYQHRRHWHSIYDTHGLFNDAVRNSDDITITKIIFSES
jgi:hypothetical protein